MCLLLAMDVGPVFSQEATATLKIYQRGGYGYLRSGFSLKINGQPITKLRPRTWFEVQVPEGKLSLETVPEFRYPNFEGQSFILEVEKGKVYYLEGLMDYEFMVSRMFLVQRDSARAVKHMKRFRVDEKAKSKLE
ncbi:MAG: hypothetical protein AAF587_01020 [Bacteroidota bacterium]